MLIKFADETEVSHWLFKGFILSCEPGACDLTRLRYNNIPYLFNHDSDFQAGQIKDVVFANRTGYAVIEWSDSTPDLPERKNIEQGIRPGSSPGLIVHEYEIVGEDEDDIFNSVLKATKWELLEVSSVTIPANPTTGIESMELSQPYQLAAPDIEAIKAALLKLNGSPDNDPDKVELPGNHGRKPPNPTKMEDDEGEPEEDDEEEMADTSLNPDGEDDPDALMEPEDEEDKEKMEMPEQEVVQQEVHNERVEILELGIKHGETELAMNYQGSAQDFRDELLSKRPVHDLRNKANANRTEEFSILRLMGAHAYPHESVFQKRAEYELSLMAGADTKGISQGKGECVPHNLFTMGQTPLYGNRLSVREIQQLERQGYSREQIEQLAVNSTGVSAAILNRIDLDRTVDYLVEGADVLPYCDLIMGLTDNIQIPVETGGITFGFNAEGSVQAASDPTYSSVSMTPHMLSAAVDLTKQALLQTNGWLETRIRRLFARQYASQVNSFFMQGTGANDQPRGLLNTTGVQEITASTLSTFSFADMVEIQEKVDQTWVPAMSRLWVAGPGAYTQLRTTQRESNTGFYLIPVDVPKMSRTLVGDPIIRSYFAGSDPGASGNKEKLIYGEFSDVQVGFWDGIEFVVDGITAPARIKITMMQFWDMVVSRPKSIAIWTES